MEPLQVPHHLSAPIYGIVAHAHIHLNLPGSEYVILQALALLEGVRGDRETFQFYATNEDFTNITGLSAPTIIKTLQNLEQGGVISRKTAPFTPTLFKVDWFRTALTFKQCMDLLCAQDDLREELNLSM
jgi:hypothetical protein